MAAVDSFQLLYREIARSCNCYVETLALVGACYTACKAVIFMRDCYSLIRVHFIPRLVCHRDLSQQYGEWAVICGRFHLIYALNLDLCNNTASYESFFPTRNEK